MKAHRKNIIINLTLLACSCTFVFCLGELVFRGRYGHYFYAPSETVLKIQAFLRTDPDLGFTWKPDIAEELQVILNVKDAELPLLSTDKDGFYNHPQAIAQAKEGVHPDIIGLGDSFMEHAADTFFTRFAAAGLSYYGRAIHRQSPPQYNLILDRYVIPAKPGWMVYGLYENDFWETGDFLRWRDSGLDWFAFHSGTWCGRPLSTSPVGRFFSTHLRGYGAFRRVLNEKLGRPNPVTGEPPDPGRMLPYVREAYERTQAAGIQFLVLIIPSKNTAFGKPTPESAAFDAMLPALEKEGIAVLDLRKPFAEALEPASLYYEEDGHWNRQGMELAADLILDRIGKTASAEN